MDLGREINQIYLFELLKNFATSLIGVFIPIYILSQGFSIYHASLFIVISGLVGIAFSYPLSKIISKIGFKHSLAFSYILIVPSLVAIQKLELSLALITISSVFYNIGRVIHNIGLNSEFATDSKKKERGKDSGRMLSLPSASRIIAPAIGGILFSTWGFSMLLTVALVSLVLSIVPLLVSSDHRDPMEYDFRDVIDRKYLMVLPLFTIRGIQAVTAVSVFGLYIYSNVGGTLDVGWARALDSLGFVLTGLVTGRIIDKYGRIKAILFGSLGAATAHFFRSIATTPFSVFIVSFVGGVFFQIYHVPLYSDFADIAEKKDVLEFYAIRKAFVSFGNIVTISTLALFTIFFDLKTGFTATFVLAGIATISMYFFASTLDIE